MGSILAIGGVDYGGDPNYWEVGNMSRSPIVVRDTIEELDCTDGEFTWVVRPERLSVPRYNHATVAVGHTGGTDERTDSCHFVIGGMTVSVEGDLIPSNTGEVTCFPGRTSDDILTGWWMY